MIKKLLSKKKISMKRLETIIKKQSIKPDDIDYLLNLYDEHINKGESETYRKCKCPGSLRIIIDELTIWYRKK